MDSRQSPSSDDPRGVSGSTGTRHYSASSLAALERFFLVWSSNWLRDTFGHQIDYLYQPNSKTVRGPQHVIREVAEIDAALAIDDGRDRTSHARPLGQHGSAILAEFV